jgi:hypothetical protein
MRPPAGSQSGALHADLASGTGCFSAGLTDAAARSGGLLLPNERAKRPTSAGSLYGPYLLCVAPPIVSGGRRGTHVTDTLRGSGPDKVLFNSVLVELYANALAVA